jgi:hypothetical protein
MNTQKIRAHAKTVAKFDLAVSDSTGTFASDLLLAMIDAGAIETPNGNYKFATKAEYKEASSEWKMTYGRSVGWTPEDVNEKGEKRRNPADIRWSNLGGTTFDPKTADPTPEEREAAEAADKETDAITEEYKTRRAELLKALNKACKDGNETAAHEATDQLLALERSRKQ